MDMDIEREADRKTDRDTTGTWKRHEQVYGQGQVHRYGHAQRHGHGEERNTDKDTDTDRDKETVRDIDRDIDRDMDRDMDRDTGMDTDTDTISYVSIRNFNKVRQKSANYCRNIYSVKAKTRKKLAKFDQCNFFLCTPLEFLEHNFFDPVDFHKTLSGISSYNYLIIGPIFYPP
jgi:hypothetical protein